MMKAPTTSPSPEQLTRHCKLKNKCLNRFEVPIKIESKLMFEVECLSWLVRNVKHNLTQFVNNKSFTKDFYITCNYIYVN